MTEKKPQLTRTKEDTIISEMLSLLAMMEEAALELTACFEHDKFDAAQIIINDIDLALDSLKRAFPPVSVQLEFCYFEEFVENISFALENIVLAINCDDQSKTRILLEFQLYPFIQEFKETIYFWGVIYPDKKKWQAYYQHEFVQNHKNRYAKANDEYKYKVSIFIPAYNKLEYTMRCVNSVFQHTDMKKNNCELILINHGSTDDTQEYFDSLHIPKTIQFKKNIGISMFSTAIRICEGQYIALVSNDVIVTENWLEILLASIESDSKIISATPTTPNVSNLQAIPIVYHDLEEGLSQFAQKFNHSDPAKWEERSRIMSPIALYNTHNLNQLGLIDRVFHQFDYWDDDFSLRARRAGFRQILHRDVYCHHFGSVTVQSTQKQEVTLKESAKLFREKHGVEAYEVGFCFDPLVLNMVQQQPLPLKNSVNILGIDCGFGDTPLQMQNFLRANGIHSQIYNATYDRRFQQDLQPLSERFCLLEDGKDVVSVMSHVFGDIRYEYIVIAQPLEQYFNYLTLLNSLKDLLSENGKLVFSISNLYSVWTLAQILSFDFPSTTMTSSFINREALIKTISPYFQSITSMGVQPSVNELELDQFIQKHFIASQNTEVIKKLLSTVSYRFICTR